MSPDFLFIGIKRKDPLYTESYRKNSKVCNSYWSGPGGPYMLSRDVVDGALLYGFEVHFLKQESLRVETICLDFK